jgi:hypothetical protein
VSSSRACIPTLAPFAAQRGVASRASPPERRTELTHHYDPNQPRVPVGHHGGGQWTGGGPRDSSSAKRDGPDRTGLLNAILGSHDSDELHGPVQLAFLDQSKPTSPLRLPRPKPIPSMLPKPKIPIPGLPYLGPILTLFSLLSDLNDDEQQTIISFRSREFRHDGPGRSFDFEGLQTLTREEAKDICGNHFEEVQNLTDKAYEEIKKNKSLSPQQLGTGVHTRVEEAIKALKNSEKTKKQYENLEAELSFAKGDGKSRRGAKDTVRLDVFNRVNDETICIDDIKTGRSDLSYSRMRELAASVSRKDPKIRRIIVTEVRPTGMKLPKPRPPTLQQD